jgi:hypothetical protein
MHKIILIFINYSKSLDNYLLYIELVEFEQHIVCILNIIYKNHR